MLLRSAPMRCVTRYLSRNNNKFVRTLIYRATASQLIVLTHAGNLPEKTKDEIRRVGQLPVNKKCPIIKTTDEELQSK